ncbi:MAG: TIGR02452 family protein [Chloroflexi bacterium]|nr:TIGR02452 family protein [Chloroflexota bacterium]
MSLKFIAKQTLEFLETGRFLSSSGTFVDFASQQTDAVHDTRLYTPDQLQILLDSKPLCQYPNLAIQVTNETTQVATHRLVQLEGVDNPALLNFASARNPGGGFINGAKAQEEDISRCSGLYSCLLTQPTYYQANRNQKSLLYSDHIIYSPKVPFFRTKSTNLLDCFFLASIITAPAPNAGEFLRRNQHNRSELKKTLKRRAGMVLSVARDNNHYTVLLGAWGCGVFRNDPHQVADIFGNWLQSSEFKGCFERVIFAVYDPSKNKQTYEAFLTRFN